VGDRVVGGKVVRPRQETARQAQAWLDSWADTTFTGSTHYWA